MTCSNVSKPITIYNENPVISYQEIQPAMYFEDGLLSKNNPCQMQGGKKDRYDYGEGEDKHGRNKLFRASFGNDIFCRNCKHLSLTLQKSRLNITNGDLQG